MFEWEVVHGWNGSWSCRTILEPTRITRSSWIWMLNTHCSSSWCCIYTRSSLHFWIMVPEVFCYCFFLGLGFRTLALLHTCNSTKGTCRFTFCCPEADGSERSVTDGHQAQRTDNNRAHSPFKNNVYTCVHACTHTHAALIFKHSVS